MAATWQCLLSLALLCVVTGTAKGSTVTCTTTKLRERNSYRYSPFYPTYEYVYNTCEWACCGTYPDEYCCNYISTGLIVGIVFGCLFLILMTTALVCCCIKKAGHSGRVVRPANNGVVLYTGTSGQYPMVQYGYNSYKYPSQPPQPPSYKPASTPPPEYNYSDPAYPPGAGPNTEYTAPPPYSAPTAPQPSFLVEQEASRSRGGDAAQGLPSGNSGVGPSSTTFPGIPPTY